MSEEMLKAVLFRCGEDPEVACLDNTLDAIREAVGCNVVQCAFSTPSPTTPGVMLDVWCDEEGRLLGKQPNRPVVLDDRGSMDTAQGDRLKRWVRDGASDAEPHPAFADVIYGDFIVLGGNPWTGETVSVPDTDIGAVCAMLPVVLEKSPDLPSGHLRPRVSDTPAPARVRDKARRP